MQEARRVVSTEPSYDNANTTSTTITRADESAAPRSIDLVRWGAIIAGLFAAIATLILLSVLGVAIGLGRFTPGDNLANLGLGAGIWGGISVLIAFFVGGWLAARTAAATGASGGILNGAMVWFVAVTLLVFTLGSGIGSLVGAGVGTAAQVAAPIIGQVAGDPALQATAQAGAQGAAQGAQATAQAAATSVTPQDVKNATTAVSNTAWGTLLALGLAALAALLGGFLGARPNPLGSFTRRETVTRT